MVRLARRETRENRKLSSRTSQPVRSDTPGASRCHGDDLAHRLLVSSPGEVHSLRRHDAPSVDRPNAPCQGLQPLRIAGVAASRGVRDRKVRSMSIDKGFVREAAPWWRVHRLSGERRNEWSVSVSANWRITFEERAE